MSPRPSPPVLPIPAILASTLLSNITTRHPKRTSVGTGCKQVDEVLDGGFRYGEITGLAVASPSESAGNAEGGGNGVGAVGRSIPLQALTTDLLASPPSFTVAYIDTTGNLSPLRLYETFLSRLRSTSHNLKHIGYMYSRPKEKDGAEGKGLEERAKALLDRVLLMRVFDFVGVAEAVAEIGSTLESNGGGAGNWETNEIEEDGNQDVEVVDAGKRPGIEEDENGGKGRVGMIIIDSMTNVVSSMMSRDHIQGHALLTTFLRSLRNLTHTHHLATLLLNSAVGTQPLPTTGSFNRQHRTNDNVSIFESTLGKPALGKTYAYLLDTSLFLSRGPSGDEGSVGREEETVVLEVLYDRFGGREGRWVALRADLDGVELRSAF